MGSRIDNNSYVLIQKWMMTDLNLCGNELLIYAIIFGFSQAEDQTYKGGLQYLADWAKISKQGVHKILTSLVSKNLINKKDYILNGVKMCEYTANLNDSEVRQPQFTPSTTVYGCQPQLINNKENNNIINSNNNYLKENNVKTTEKEPRHHFGEFGRVLLTDSEYERLVNDYGQTVADNQIKLLDEYVEGNNNKNKYTNYNLVLRRSIREGWFNKTSSATSKPNKPKCDAYENLF